VSKHAKTPLLIARLDKNGNPQPRCYFPLPDTGVKPGNNTKSKNKRNRNHPTYIELCKQRRLQEEKKGVDTSSAHDKLLVRMKFDTKRKARVGLPIYYRSTHSEYWHPGRLSMSDDKFYVGVTEEEKKRANADGTMFCKTESGIVEWKFQ